MCLQAITRVEPAYWDDLGIKRIVEFADAVTNKVFSKKESIDKEELDGLAVTEAIDYAIPKSWSKEFVFATGFKAGFRLKEAMV